ncbi:hypothetical protein BJV82DRAFT_655653 [Fennellomyces sp. T-0311]|nr:hypothetical protein BJV82DRAFT_655653 [Fennellomyces sp. T-0311]
MQELRSRIPPVPQREQQRRGRLGAVTRFQELFVNYYIDTHANCDVNGKIHHIVYVDESFEDWAAEKEGIFVGKSYAGQAISLEVDPAICEHALVLKTRNFEIAAPNNHPEGAEVVPKLIEDFFLLLHFRESYFVCFNRTLRQLHLYLRPFVEEEYRNPQFEWVRIIRLWVNDNFPAIAPYEVASGDVEGYTYLYGTLRATVQQHAATEYETVVWNYYIDTTSQHNELF